MTEASGSSDDGPGEPEATEPESDEPVEPEDTEPIQEDDTPGRPRGNSVAALRGHDERRVDVERRVGPPRFGPPARASCSPKGGPAYASRLPTFLATGREPM